MSAPIPYGGNKGGRADLKPNSALDYKELPKPTDAKTEKETDSKRVGNFNVKNINPGEMTWIMSVDDLKQDDAVKMSEVDKDFYLPLGSCVGVFLYDSDGKLSGVSHHNRGSESLEKIKEEIKESQSILVVKGPTSSRTQDFLVESIKSSLSGFGAKKDSIQIYASPNYDGFEDSITSGIVTEVKLSSPIKLHYYNNPIKAFAVEEVKPVI